MTIYILVDTKLAYVYKSSPYKTKWIIKQVYLSYTVVKKQNRLFHSTHASTYISGTILFNSNVQMLYYIYFIVVTVYTLIEKCIFSERMRFVLTHFLAVWYSSYYASVINFLSFLTFFVSFYF